MLILGLGVVVAVAALLMFAMALPESRHEHAQKVLGIIPRTVEAWRRRDEVMSAASGPEILTQPGEVPGSDGAKKQP